MRNRIFFTHSNHTNPGKRFISHILLVTIILMGHVPYSIAGDRQDLKLKK